MSRVLNTLKTYRKSVTISKLVKQHVRFEAYPTVITCYPAWADRTHRSSCHSSKYRSSPWTQRSAKLVFLLGSLVLSGLGRRSVCSWIDRWSHLSWKCLCPMIPQARRCTASTKKTLWVVAIPFRSVLVFLSWFIIISYLSVLTQYYSLVNQLIITVFIQMNPLVTYLIFGLLGWALIRVSVYSRLGVY